MEQEFLFEKWKAFSLGDCDPKLMAFKISNYGRVKIKTKTQTEYRMLEKFLHASGFKMFFYKKKGNKAASYYVHRAVALLFLEKTADKKFVIHLDHDPLNNAVSNLKWVNRSELVTHQHKNQKRQVKKGYKLTEGRVRVIKRKLADPNNKTRIKMIAKQFGISTMQVWRIKSGENWSDVKIDDKEQSKQDN